MNDLLMICQKEDHLVPGDPGLLSHDNVDGWMSGAENVGWRHLVFLELS